MAGGVDPQSAIRAGLAALQARDPARAVALLRDYEQSGIGWFWSSDHEGRLTYISDCVAKSLGR